MKKISITIIKVLAFLVGLPLLLILGMVFSPSPAFASPVPSATGNIIEPLACEPDSLVRCLTMRDGITLAASWFDANSQITVVLLHGVKSDRSEMENIAQMLQKQAGVNVLSVDLRGHGNSGGKRGDVNYIGQYEHDLADIVTILRKEHPNETIILSGHSMGGGIVMRYTSRNDVPKADAYLLFAPHLGIASPTSQPQTAQVQPAEDDMVKIHLARTFGLGILNLLHVSIFNGLDTLYFNIPENSVQPNQYSYRAMASSAPDNYIDALTTDDLPMLVIVGEKDEAFRAEEYPQVISLHSNGNVVIIPDESHDGIIQSQEVIPAIKSWIVTLRNSN